MSQKGLVHGGLGGECVHICVDMQNLFAPGSPWAVPWLGTVLPLIEEIAIRHKRQTVFTRFVPPADETQATGMWRHYYRRWRAVTRANLAPETIDLVAPLRRLAPPATIIDKAVYSPWLDGMLDRFLHERRATTLVVTGGETDICVLATVMGAIDRGFRVIIVRDAVCSSADETHDALMTLYRSRFSEQVELVSAREVLSAW